jgi:glycosyltransferase involved in cell wall biosynthesis
VIKPKASLLLPALAMGGAEKVIVEIANGLSIAGWPVDVVTMSESSALSSALNEKVTRINLNSRTYRDAVWRFRGYLNTERPCVVLTSLYATGLAALGARIISYHKPKVIVGAHNSLRAKVVNPDNIKDRLFLLPLCKLLFPLADRFVAVSRGVGEELQSMLDLAPGRVEVIYNPVVGDRLLSLAREPVEHPWLSHPLNRQFKTVISVGRLVKQKGFDVLLRAFARLRTQHNVRLIVIGDGPLADSLRGLAESLSIRNDVMFLGNQPNPHKFVSRADLFALSSRWEGFGNVVVEALACGVPVVATKCQYGPQEILDNGTYGTLVPVDDYVGLADAMKKALFGTHRSTEDRGALEKRGREFSVRRSVEEYVRVFSQECAL